MRAIIVLLISIRQEIYQCISRELLDECEFVIPDMKTVVIHFSHFSGELRSYDRCHIRLKF